MTIGSEQDRAPAVPSPDTVVSRPEIDAVRRARKRRTRLILVLRVGLLALAVGAWQLFSGRPGDPFVVIDEFYLSNPQDILVSLWQWVTDGTLFPNLWVTAQETLIGFAVGALAGFLVGFVLGTSGVASAVLRPYIVALNSVPRLALVPLFILWFGLGLTSKVVFVAMIVFFLVFYNTFAGAQDVDSELMDILKVMGAGRFQVHRMVTLPSASTWIIAGLGVSVPYALVAAVTAEIVASNSGMGYLLNRSAGQFDTAGVFAAIIILVVMGLLLAAVVTRAERYLLRWKTENLRQSSGL